MLEKLKSMGPARVRNDSVVGLCLNRALAVAVAPALPGPPAATSHVLVEELPTESLGQIKVLTKAVAAYGIKGRAAAITLSPGSYTLLQIERPPVEDDELVAAARWRVKNMLDYPVDEAVLQVFDAPQPNERQRSPMLNVVAAPARAVREQVGIVRKAGLVPQKVTVAEFALRGLVSPDGGSAPAVTIFLTARAGMIQVTRNGEIYLSRRLDYGLSSIKPVDVLATGIHNTLPLELRRTVDYFDSHFSAGNIRRILAGPAEDNFMSFMRQAAEVVGLDVAPLELNAELHRAASKSSDYGLPEAYFALGGALSLQQTSVEERVAV
jgi:MSHA biogenesis protein MshI